MTHRLLPLAAAALACLAATNLEARDWARFRGPDGAGITPDEAPPVEWGDEKNLAWRIELPGPGSSCPIVVGDKVLVTCWTGYGLSREDPGDQANLMRSLLCYDRESGKELWRAEVEPKLPEDDYGGMFAEHGYASHTPVSDGKNVYVFFGKTGALAFDLEGNKLWQTDCGDGSGAKDWGSAASPLLYGDLVICSAFAESDALIALDKATGEEVWRKSGDGWNGDWSTPILVEAKGTATGDRTELVVAAPFKMLGLDPATGEELWNCQGIDNDTVTTSPVEHDGVVYVVAGRGGAFAVKAGGDGEVDDTHVVWRGEMQGGITSPIYYEGKLFSIGRGGLNCYDAATSERVYQERFAVADAPAAEEAPAEGGPGRGRRGRRGGFGSMPYSSPVAAGDLLYHFGRDGVGFVVRLGDEYEQLATNKLTDGGDFSATPALSDGVMYVRSSKYLYCIKAVGDRVAAR